VFGSSGCDVYLDVRSGGSSGICTTSGEKTVGKGARELGRTHHREAGKKKVGAEVMEEFGYLLGVLSGDGCLLTFGCRAWRVVGDV
jgi:hypothetical protein